MAKNMRDEAFDDVEFDDEQEEEQEWDDWKVDDDEEGDLLCLFCDSKFTSGGELFKHCISSHHFDFHGIRKSLGFDFYASFKLINYVRSQVAQNRCWSCGLFCQTKQEPHNHLHELANSKEIAVLCSNDNYLNPFMQDDPLLYSFDEDDEYEEDSVVAVDKEEVLSSFEKIRIDYESDLESYSGINKSLENGTKEVASASNNISQNEHLSEKLIVSDCDVNYVDSSEREPQDRELRASSSIIMENKIVKANKNYFEAYSSFGIHREMISDKIRTDAYRQAVLGNPSLLNGAVVLDVGCGTGILSLFSAQGGASRVIAVEASNKMAAVARKIAEDNDLLRNGIPNESSKQSTGVIEVFHGMVEELNKSSLVEPHSVDVLLSEWMGYCLLYESMLSSVLLARDQWLKPGGAILPDTATMFVAGFGKGATSIPFWENVYGFNMSCVGKELVENAAQVPIIDVVDFRDIVTSAAVLQTFDLVSMKPEEMDFTATAELEPQLDNNTEVSEQNTSSCYGVVLWFDTSFTSRFCKEMPTVLSTSPYIPKTHWSQTILTFREPISIASPSSSGKTKFDKLAPVGTDSCPAVKIQSRISIARAVQHRSIDISVEVVAIGPDGQKRSYPAQLFNL